MRFWVRLEAPGIRTCFIRTCFVHDAGHGFRRGVSDAQVAALLGHSGTAMLHKYYSHLTGQARTLREALGRVR